MSWFTWAVDVSKIAGGVGVAVGFLKGVGAWWSDGPGRRKHWINAYRKIACKVQASYVESLFGIPPFKLQGENNHVRRIWVLGREGYLTVDTVNESVVSYSITTSSPKFRPLVAFGSHNAYRTEEMITLGVTTFAEAMAKPPSGFSLDVGGRRGIYAERHWTGSPGGYLHWILGSSDLGAPHAWDSPHFDEFRNEYVKHSYATRFMNRDGLWGALDIAETPGHDGFRRTAVVNTLTISSDQESSPDLGADVDTVRLLASAPTWRERLGGGTRARAARVRARVRRRSRNVPPTSGLGDD